MRAWLDITAFGQHNRSNDVGCGMISSPLGSTHGRTTSSMAWYHLPWTAHTVGRHRAWHAIIALGPAQSVGRRRAWHTIIALGHHKRSAIVGRAYTERSAVACPHRSWLARHCSSSKQNMRTFMPYINQRILKQPTCKTNIFIYFPLSIL